MSLRARLLITMVVLVTVGLAVADVATYRYLSSFLLERVGEQLSSAVGPAADALSVRGGFGGHHEPPGGFPVGTLAELRDSNGNTTAGPMTLGPYEGPTPSGPALPADLPGSAASPEPEATVVLTTGSTGSAGPSYRVLARADSDGLGTLVVAIPLTEYSATLTRLLVVESAVSGAVVLLVAGLALWLVRLGLRPLEGIGETAGAIAAGDLTRRVEPADDRTEVGRLGLALNSMLAQIEVAFDERRASEVRLRRFVGDASHELRTPLTSIRGYAELFRRGAESRPEDLAKTMLRIEEEAARMGILVDDLLLLARLDQGRPLGQEPLDLNEIVSEAVESARVIEPDRPIELELDGATPMVGDHVRLRQVVDNLLNNVRVHTPSGTPVHVALRSTDDSVILSVADEGPGLSPDVATRAFERFYRGDPARSRETGGAGLGLSIVSAIVEAHGGSVHASTQGTGATFDVRLPRGGTGQLASDQEVLPTSDAREPPSGDASP